MAKKILYLLIIIVLIVILVPRLNNSFYEHHGFNDAFYSQIARNYLRYGLVYTAGAQITNKGTLDKKYWSLHTHHPATYPIMLAGLFSVFGIGEWQARILSLLASIAGILLLATHLKYKYAVFPIIFTPLFLFYAIMPVYEPILLPLTVLGLIAYHKKNGAGLFIASFLAVLIDWPGYWVPVGIIILEALSKKKDLKLIKSAFLAILLGTLIIILHQLLVTGFKLQSLLEIGQSRFEFTNQPYSSTDWVRLLISRAKAFYGLPLIFTTLAGTFLALKERQNLKIILLALFVAGAHILVFRNVTWYHDYMLYHAIPFVAITTSFFFVWLKKRLKNNIFVPITIIVVMFLTFAATNRFFADLSNLKEGDRCIAESIGYNCEVFINFYTDPYGR